MEAFIIILIAAMGLIGSFTSRTSGLHFQLAAITGLCLIWVSKSGFAPADPYQSLLLLLTIMVVAGYFAGMFLPKRYSGFITLLFTLVPVFFIGKSFTYFGYQFEVTAKIAFLAFLGGLVPLIGNLKAVLFKKWVGAEVESTGGAIAVLLSGFLVFFATFQAQYLGVILAGSGLLTVGASMRSQRYLGNAIALLSIGFLFALMKLNPAVDDSFMRGNFMMGALLGAGTLAWSAASKSFHRFSWIFGFLLPSLLVFAAVMMGIANENFGAVPAYAGAVAGALIALAVSKKPFDSLPVHAVILGLSLPVLSQFAVKPVKAIESRISKTEAAAAPSDVQPDELAVPEIATSSGQEGLWKSVKEKSKLEFNLGPEGGKTQGAFKDFTVTLDMNEKGEPVLLSLDMKAMSITTFNDMRDESVRGEGFMEADKFPKVKYTSKTFKKEGDRYFVTGEFEMLGKKQPVNLEIKFAAKGMEKNQQYLVMIGKAVIDRTKFGMEGDAKIGNEVNTTFEIEFRK